MDGIEQWGPVVGYEGEYEASTRGRVRSVDRTVFQKGGTWRYRSYILRQDVSKRGYHRVVLSRGNQRRTVNVHRLMGETFLPNPENLPMVRHLDDNKGNNVIENLAWGTNSDNQKDSIRNGTHYGSSKTHCPENHPYDEGNTYSFTRNGRPGRKCRKCHALKERVRRKDRRG